MLKFTQGTLEINRFICCWVVIIIMKIEVAILVDLSEKYIVYA